MIVIDSNIPYLDVALQQRYTCVVVPSTMITNTFLKDVNCKKLFIRTTTKVTKELLQNTNIDYVGTATSGSDHIDKEYCTQHEIHVDSAQGSNATSVAEYCLYGILRWITQHTLESEQCCVGIIGYGNIGKRLDNFLQQCNIKTLIHDAPLQAKQPQDLSDLSWSTPEEIISTCNIITHHVPLEHNTLSFPTFQYKPFTQAFNRCESGLYIIPSRGTIFRELDLRIDMNRYPNWDYIIDVWDNEPDFTPTLVERAMFATPHIAGHSYDGKLRGSLLIAQLFSKFENIHLDYTCITSLLFENQKTSLEGMHNHDIIAAIEQSRKLSSDDAIMRLITGYSKEVRSQYFQNFRRNYPIRREVFHSLYDDTLNTTI